MPTRINLIAIRSAEIDRAVLIYESIGLRFERHAHGNGPEHYSSEVDGFVFEIYPLSFEPQSTASTRIGFEVDSVDQTISDALSAGAKLIAAPKQSPWGYRGVIADIDGRRIELLQKSIE